ncbi:MAG: SDR family NAD(P)-dependent oxidoreductase, partial [Thermoplasmatota archaeon]
LFGELREHFGVPFDESLSLADYNTLRKVAEYMGQGAAQAAPAAVIETAETPKVDAMTAPILRRVPTLRPAPSPNASNNLPAGRVIVVGAEDGVPMGALAEHGWTVDGDEAPVGIIALDLKPRDGGVVGDLFDVAKANPGVSFVLVATKQDGAHGLELPRDAHMAALAGLGKSLKKEFADAVVKVVDLDPDLPATLAVEELVSGGTRTEICFDAEGTRFEIDVAPEVLEGTPDVSGKTLVVSGGAQGITVELLAALAPQAPNLILLGRTDVPDAAETWATWTDADWKEAEQERMAAMREAGEKVTPVSLQKGMSPMKKAADVRRNLDRLTELGAEVLYCPVDVTDMEAVKAAVGHGRERFGSIDGVIHAAGVEISKDLGSKDRAQFDLVYGIKHDGWQALMAATDKDRLEFLAAFGSVAGRFGNIGQTDYAAANEFLCKAVKTEAATRGVPTAFTIAWGPWGEVGMATKGSIMQIMEASGVTPIPTADGVRMFLAEMANPGVRECVVAGMVGAIDADGQVVDEAFDPRIGDLEAKMAATPEAFRLLDGIESVSEHGLVARLVMDQAVDPYAGDHAIDGVPLLPGVFGIEAFAEASSLLADADHVCLGAEDVRFSVPLKQLKERPATASVEVHRHGDGFACRLTSRMVGPDGVARGEPRVHFEAILKFGPAEAPITSKEVPETDGSRDFASIYPPFFHGPSFQVLRGAGPLGDESVGTGQLPYAAAFSAGEPDFHTHPLVIEALFQVCGLRTMAVDDVMSLPAGIDQVDILSHEPPKEDYRLWCRYNGEEDGMYRFDAVAATASGRVLVRLVGYSMVPTGPVPTVEPKAQVQATLTAPAPEPTLSETPPIPMANVDLPELEGASFAAVPTGEHHDGWFTADELATEFAAGKRLVEWRAGRLAAKAAAMQMDDSLAPRDVTVVNEDGGKPILHIRGAPVDVCLSLTHRDGLAIAAISQEPLGIDLEVVEERPQTWLHESFNEAEQPLAASAMGATCLWAAKEAAFKRIGDGLKQALHAWTVQPDGEGGATIAGPDATFGVRFYDVDGRVLAVTAPAFDLTVTQ